MAAIVFGAAISLRTFAVAMMAVVLLQPEYVATPGFQMSFAATGALIANYEVWRNHRSCRETVLGPIAFSWASIEVTSVVAGLATMPFALFHFDRASPIGFAANLAAMQIVTFFSAPPAALAFLLAPFSLSDVSLRLFRYSLELVLAVAHFFSRFSGEVAGTDRPIPETSLILASAALGAFIALNGRLRQVMGGGLLAAALGAWMRSPRLVAHWSPSGDLFLARPSGEIVRVHLLKGGGLAPLRFSEVDDATCADTNCEFETASGLAIQVHNADPLSVCFAATVAPTAASGTPGQPSDSRDKLCWTGSDISEQGARTPYLDGRALKEEDAISCGPRPWNGCAPT